MAADTEAPFLPDHLALVCGVLLLVCHFPIGILGQVWYLIVLIPDLCTLTYLGLFITNGIVSSKIHDKLDDFNFEIMNFPFLEGDVPRSPSYGVCISQLIRFARVCSNVDDFNNGKPIFDCKVIKIRITFSKFYHRHTELNVKHNIGLKTLLQQGISEPIFYGDLVYKFKRIVGKPNFSD